MASRSTMSSSVTHSTLPFPVIRHTHRRVTTISYGELRTRTFCLHQEVQRWDRKRGVPANGRTHNKRCRRLTV